MKKKILIALSCGVIASLLAACGSSGISKEEYDSIVQERDKYKTLYEALANDSESSEDVDTINSEQGDEAPASNQQEFHIGETWEVPGKFKVTVSSVVASDYRNQFDDSNPGAVYVITYTYENIGLNDDLYVNMDGKIVDNAGKMGTSYPGDYSMYPQAVPTGANCEAEAWIAVETPGSFKSYVSIYDDEYNEHSAVFSLDVQ